MAKCKPKVRNPNYFIRFTPLTKIIMNKVLKALIAVVFSCGIVTSQAQTVEITPIVGYQFGLKANAIRNGVAGNIRIVPAMNYGAAINVGIPAADTRIEFMWTRQDSRAEWQAFTSEVLEDVAVEYFMLSGLREMEFGALTPFGGLSVGAVNFAGQTSGETGTRMAVGFQGGAKYMITDNIGLRAHVRFLMPVQWFSAGFTIGTGGAGAGVGASSTIFSGDVGGGLVIRLGQTE